MYPDLGVVDALARLKLAALRLGYSIRVHEPSAELVELLDLVGLTPELEVIGEAEGGEEVGVEEAVEPADPVA
jgi:phosphoglycolate phosphatase-like HAD superfamily hydrolase